MAVGLFDSSTPLAPLRDELRRAIDEVLEGGAFVLGPQVGRFEDEFAGYLGPDGLRPGGMGAIATTSFYPSKNLGAFGDGGAVTTSDDALATRVRTLRFHGSEDKVTYTEVGYNSRLDELQAAILRVQLP